MHQNNRKGGMKNQSQSVMVTSECSRPYALKHGQRNESHTMRGVQI